MSRPEIVPADRQGLRMAAELLRSGGVCAFPTETVYGLGGNALSRSAVSEIYRLKERPFWNPLIVHVKEAQSARSLAKTWPSAAETLAAGFWPGPLTLVVERAAGMPSYANTHAPTVAIRVPQHPVALALLEECDLPLAAPSANLSGQLSPTRPEHVVASLPNVPLVLDGGPCAFGIESTVVDVTCSPPRILRHGALSRRQIEEVVGPVVVPDVRLAADQARSPGRADRHYAPRTPLIMLSRMDRVTIGALPRPVGVVSHRPLDDDVARAAGFVEVLPDAPARYAAALYDCLHALDGSGAAAIAVLVPPASGEWDAVRDRLARAAVPADQS